MSTLYMFERNPNVSFDVLKRKLREKDAIDKYGIKYSVTRGNTKSTFVVTDGINYLHVYKTLFGWMVERFGGNNPEEILNQLEGFAGSRAVSEHNDLYWEISDRLDKEYEEEKRRKKSGDYKLVKPHKRRR